MLSLCYAANPRKLPKEMRVPLEAVHEDDTEPAVVAEPLAPAPPAVANSADHTYFTKDVLEARTLKRKMDFVIQQTNRIRKRLKYSNVKVRRLRRKVKSFSEVVASLMNGIGLRDSIAECIFWRFVGCNETHRALNIRLPTRALYPAKLKTFALALSFHSMKTYFTAEHLRRCA
jgi:hypothetical protein